MSKEKALNQFLGIDEEKTKKKAKNKVKTKILEEREGLIERLDPILVTKEGKQLLREQY